MFILYFTLFSVGGEPASLVISSQIAVAGQGAQMTKLTTENPVTINFQFPAVPVVRFSIECISHVSHYLPINIFTNRKMI